ncbi:methyltransferase domain-containing protein [Nesterenkonia muleiensis]|uniref:methyltransferase domain-containing protein n=1 Tax=Nesterenkonia muleiensis TaxID=2282648 RepID=UPI000E7553BA|nr:methyltransferase domain-containing protein [Nesterenkonia muleiensis]
MPTPASGESAETAWNPSRYLAFASERTRPFIDLLSRVNHPNARSIIDYGCGPGNGMPVLRHHWPAAHITGVDSSAQMLDAAREYTRDDAKITYQRADIRTFAPAEQVDLVVSNAALQWLPDHRDLLPEIQRHIAPGGVLAVQIPGNFAAPSHRLLYELAGRSPYAEHIVPGSLLNPTAGVIDYMLDVAGDGWEVEAWETTYQHILQGEDPVFDWISGAAARPVLSALPPQELEQFTAEYKAALREAYPRTRIGTILSFRRIFFIARRASPGH